jgi:predicted permease
MLGELWRRCWFLLNRRRFERELREEMDAHRSMQGTDAVPFGNSLRLRDEAVDAWGWRWLERLQQDVSFGCRLLWRSPAFTLTALTVLSLGIGVNLAAFQVFDRVALSPRPVREPETLVNLYRRSPRSTSTTFSYPAFDFHRRHASRLRSAMARVPASVSLGDDETRRRDASFVTANYFAEMGTAPLLGRLFDAGDERPDAAPVVVISEDFWRSALAADAGVLARPLRVNGRPLSVIGIVPRTFVGLEGRTPSAWVPITQHGAVFPGSTLLEDWTGGAVAFYGRVPSEFPIAAVEGDLRLIVNALRAERPHDVWDDEWLELRDASRMVSLPEAAPAFALVGALVALVLVAACMNLGLLVLARTLVRGREFAVRFAVGATRPRLVRQLLTEHLLLGLLGTAAGSLVAMPMAAAVLRFAGESPAIEPTFNLRTVLTASALAILASVAFGFAPLWQTLRPASSRRFKMRSLMLAAQVAAATALLILSGLLVRAVTRTVRVDLGFDYEHTLVADPDLGSHGLAAAPAAEYWRRVETRLRLHPGVRNVAVSTLPPLGNRVAINGERTVFYDVTPAYFDTMQIPILRGRIFRDGERGVVLVSETLAARHWPGEDALGKSYDGNTVIGVAGNARTVRLNERGATECYRAIQPSDMPSSVAVVRVDGDPRRSVPGIRAILRMEDTRLAPEVTALDEALAEKLAGPRQAAQLISLLGVCALLLAATGLGGFVAFTVSERLREIGVRLALGAGPSDIARAVLRQFRAPLVYGAVAGSLLAACAGMILASELFGVSSFDPAAHVGAVALFTVVAALAVLPSLRRAVRVDPIHTLRHE